MPVYDLEKIRKAAKALRIEYAGRKVTKDTGNLGYELSDVGQCICCLTENDFKKTINYPDLSCDVYLTKFTKTGNRRADEIYIKLRLINQYLEIELMSFHL